LHQPAQSIMIKWHLVFNFFVLFLLYSCAQRTEKLKKEPLTCDQFLSPLHFHSNYFSNLSYPLWYNKTWIKTRKIKSITLRNFKNEPTNDSIHQEFPLDKKIYYFSDQGELIRLHIFSYYDDKEISEQVIVYPTKQEKSGFQWCEIYQKPDQKPLLDTIFKASENEVNITYFKKIKSERRYCSMMNIQTGNFTHLLYPKKYWGVLSVDSILKPKPDDIVVYGTAKKPFKQFNVKSKVIESNVCNIMYWKNGLPKAMQYSDLELQRSLHFNYNAKGRYTGYKDSTFLEQTYLFEENQYIGYNILQLPDTVKHFRLSPIQEKIIIDRFTFTYSFYE
jgi:hypothetical protein